jgi:hypothetical protein
MIGSMCAISVAGLIERDVVREFGSGQLPAKPSIQIVADGEGTTQANLMGVGGVDAVADFGYGEN